ncbi:MAG: SpoIIE family protein phosphatase [Anaerolineae bacterium]|nr:SpoIIE family protein phosphatase [Anaerolineae bacterium]
MMKSKKPDHKKQTGLQPKRPTIGLFVKSLGEFHATIQAGVTEVTGECGANFIMYVGEAVRNPGQNFEAQGNIIYNLVSPERIDGLIMVSSSIGSYVPTAEFTAFCRRYAPLPVVNVLEKLEGIPSVIIDDTKGLQDLITHLIVDHGYRRIAFLQGPQHNLEAKQRYQIYAEVLTKHNLPLDPALVVPGDYQVEAGMKSMQMLLDRNVTFEAIVAANDLAAIGALQVLEARDIHVPGDVAIVGIGDGTVNRVVPPPLSTVGRPLAAMGRKAAEMVLAQGQGEEVPQLVTLQSEMIIRQSCGCSSLAARQAVVQRVVPVDEGFEAVFSKQRDDILTAILKAIAPIFTEVEPARMSEWAEKLLDAFAAALMAANKEETPNVFLQELDRVLRQARHANRGVTAWQRAISVLQRHLRPYLANDDLVLADSLWQQARVVIGETAEQVVMFQMVQTEQRTQRLDRFSQTLITTFDMTKLMDILAEGLPPLPIPSAYLALFEDPAAPDEWARLMLAYDAANPAAPKRIDLPPEGLRFPARELAPPGMLPPDRRYNYVVEPLYFQDQQIGFVLFEMGAVVLIDRLTSVYDTLRGMISSALKGALLVQQEEKRFRQLQTVAKVSTTVSTVLDTTELLQKVVDLTKESFGLYHAHLYLFDESGENLVLAAGAGQVGRQMIAKGWSISRRQEQSLVARAARTGQGFIVNNVRETPHWLPNPLLPDTCSELAVPLMVGDYVLGVLDVQADEINYFTDDDIQIQSTLAAQIAVALNNASLFEQINRANAEIASLNERLKFENVRMTAELDVSRRLQQMLLPTKEELQQIKGLDIAGYMEPADEVGGDYYDVLKHNGSVKIGIGDVTGHGLESGVVMLMLQTAVRTLLTSGIDDPIRFLDIINRMLHANLQRMRVDKSLSLALLDYATSQENQMGRMRLSGQHEQLIVVRQGGQIELQNTLDLGFPVGLVTNIGQFVDELSIDLQSGDGVVLYSDGITEAENKAGDFYGLERLCTVVGQHWAQPAEVIKEAVVTDVRQFIGQQKLYDDLTLLVIKQK